MKPHFVKEKDAIKEMKAIGVDIRGIPYMVDKTKFRLIKLYGIRNAIANIMKEEMLALGGDVAKNKGCVNCTVPKSDVLIMGTIKQIRGLMNKLKVNVAECSKVAEEIEKIVKND